MKSATPQDSGTGAVVLHHSAVGGGGSPMGDMGEWGVSSIPLAARP